ncbi:MAG TPA: hypothetical protein VKT30_12300 [Caulobacteraceae bacterium]|nr:hypothetical protein [Caulobacteraceae bacterium]
MRAFDYIILFFSFVFALGLTHLLLASARMIRLRRQIVFSWPHALWMLVALLTLGGNWLSFWDFHDQRLLTLPVIIGGFGMVILQYYVCALVAPEFEDGQDLDLRRFHLDEGRTYLIALMALWLYAIVVNALSANATGAQAWARQNLVVLLGFAPIAAALVFRQRPVQLLAPLVVIALSALQIALYYPVLR